MADYQQALGSTKPDSTFTMTGNIESISHGSVSSRAQRKLGRTGSRSWFNRSVDESSTKPIQARTLRKQKLVTDFVQNMLVKGKSHLQDIFSSKKDKYKRYTSSDVAIDGVKQTTRSSVTTEHIYTEGAIGGVQDSPVHSLQSDISYSSLHNSCPNFFDNEDFLTHLVVLKQHGSFNCESKVAYIGQRRVSMSGDRLLLPNDCSATIKMFMVKGADNCQLEAENISRSDKRGLSVSAQNSHLELPASKSRQCRTMTSKCVVYPVENTLVSSQSRKGHKGLLPTMTLRLPYGAPHNTEKSFVFRRKLSPASPRRRSSPFASLPADDPTSLPADDPASLPAGDASSLPENNESSLLADDIWKPKLVKSNSDTLAKLFSFQQPLSKASSDGNCFKNSSVSSLASSMTSVSNIMVSITDYLFLGSIEAAYNEPLLCKYNISSLIDMANVNLMLIPPNKKSDCPCACASKPHFRSKLNIGLDDIEWEDLEQYFADINAFINGARQNNRRVLVFSYMGQSRAPAAVIQHIMQQYNFSYKRASDLVRAKRPQTKINSGFVKALLRLEKRLVVDDSDVQMRLLDGSIEPASSLNVSLGSVTTLDIISSPPVVRGAWLEC